MNFFRPTLRMIKLHFSADDRNLSRPRGSKAAPNHLMLVCCDFYFFYPHIALCVPSKQLNFGFICPQNMLPVVLGNIQVTLL